MGSSTLQLTASAAATEGVFLARIAGTSGAVSRGTGVLLTVGSPPIPISVGQTIAGTLAAADPVSQERTGKHADFYKLTLIASTAVTIDLKSRIFDPFLYLLSASGTILFSDDQSGGSNNARITQTLGSGTYLIEVTTFLDGARGDYTLSINTPTISAIAPGFGGQGSTVTVRLTGARFSSPMTVSAGSGITVSNVTVASATSATVTLAIASNAAFTPRDLTVSTPEGTSNPVTFAVPTPINVGERISGTLATTDRISQNSLYRYSDLYQFTVNSSVPLLVFGDGFNSSLR